ncbi:inosine-uridine nucleoside N-ribohydrolase [Streptomyces afghaniensis]|nr:inosine-uridine nucleoside N-ribohydrolase [Streptomyces afghaniensis]
MYGLDVFKQVLVPAADVQRLRAGTDPSLRLAGELLAHRDPATSGDPTPTGGLGDAGAVCAVVDPGGLTTERLPVEVALAPGPTRGQTIVDRRPLPGESEIHEGTRAQPMVDVALGVDVERYVKLWLTVVEGA